NEARRFVSLAARSRCEPTLTGLVGFPESRATSAYFRVTESSGRKPWRGSAAARVATVRLVKGAKNVWVNWYGPLRAATGWAKAHKHGPRRCAWDGCRAGEKGSGT